MIVTAIVPCFNEALALPKAYAEIKKVLEEHSRDGYEILFVDDGSTDDTLPILEDLAARDPTVKVVSLSRNFGKEAAMSAGIASCAGDMAVFFDADLQDPPNLLPEMLELHQRSGCNVVYGVRKKRKDEGLLKRLTSKMFYRILRMLSDITIPLDSADFKLIDRRTIEEFKHFSERNKFVRGIVSWIGLKQVPFYYEREARTSGSTRYPPASLFRLSATGIVYFSKRPLELVIMLGFTCIFVGFLLLIWMLISVISPAITPTSGWASIITAIVFFAGVQLLTLGIIGMYVGNIFDEVKRRPEYIVKSTTNIDKTPEYPV